MTRFRDSEGRRLMQLTINSQASVQALREKLNKAERILKLAEVTRKLETEREKVHGGTVEGATDGEGEGGERDAEGGGGGARGRGKHRAFTPARPRRNHHTRLSARTLLSIRPAHHKQ
jgi:hypothetical protein